MPLDDLLLFTLYSQLRAENDAQEAAVMQDTATLERLSEEIAGFETVVQEVATAAGVGGSLSDSDKAVQ